jgi:type VI protein secretion system component VasK
MFETLVEYADLARGNQLITLAIALAVIVATSLLWSAGERVNERKRRKREKQRQDDEARGWDA